MTPLAREFLDDLEARFDGKDWPNLDRDRVTVTPANAVVHVVLPHRQPDGHPVELVVDEREVVVTYGPEHVTFTRRDEALQFVEMLGDGRVELVVRRALVWTSMRSYRDGLALPFRKTSEPWINPRPRTERLQFGFR